MGAGQSRAEQRRGPDGTQRWPAAGPARGVGRQAPGPSAPSTEAASPEGGRGRLPSEPAGPPRPVLGDARKRLPKTSYREGGPGPADEGGITLRQQKGWLCRGNSCGSHKDNGRVSCCRPPAARRPSSGRRRAGRGGPCPSVLHEDTVAPAVLVACGLAGGGQSVPNPDLCPRLSGRPARPAPPAASWLLPLRYRWGN